MDKPGSGSLLDNPPVAKSSSNTATAAVVDKYIDYKNDDLVTQDHSFLSPPHAEAAFPATASGYPTIPSPLAMPPPAAPPAEKSGAFKHVNDEILSEQKEVKVRGRTVFENCPE